LKKSITKRMFLGIISVVIVFAVILMIANTLLLSPLYYRSLENSMTEVASRLVTVDFSTDRTTWINEVSDISSGNAFDVVIRKNGITVFSSSMDIGLREFPEELEEPVSFMPDKDQRPNDPFRPMTGEMEWKETVEGILVGYSEDPRTDSEFIVCTTTNDDGYTILLTQPVEPIDASIVQSNLLLIIVTVAMLIVSILFAFVFAKGFTKPIKEIKGRVEQISNLDFSGTLKIDTGDELESLSGDVNLLAAKLKDALDELQEKNKQLEKDIIAQKRFISNASHELRTPLSLIKGYADELNSGYIRNEASREQYLGIISEESTKLNRLLNEMLDLSRLESGRMKLEEEDIQINDFIMTIIEKYAGFIKEKGLSVEFNGCEEHVVKHDSMRMEQILANFISNAAKYSDSRREVIISTKLMDEAVRISVFNTGQAIDEDSLDRIWEGFFKADNSRTREEGSYGLGLSIVRAIQETVGQSYGVLNHDDGVEFWFEAGIHE